MNRPVIRRVRGEARRRRRLGLTLAGFFLGAITGGCAVGPHVLTLTEQHVIDRQFVEYPAGCELRRYIGGLTAPTAFDFDADKNLVIVQGGLGDDDPTIVGFRPDGAKFDIFPLTPRIPLSFGSGGFKMYGPVGGLACYNGRIFVSHRDSNGYGVITAFDYYGGHRTVIAGLPAQGEYGVTQIAIDSRSGLLYFGVGTATNSGVVGMDDWELGWVKEHPEVCDRLGNDRVRTTGQRFDTPNPAALWFASEIAVTGPFQPFNVSNQTLIRKRTDKVNGVIYSIPAGGGTLKIEATGIHNPRGLAFSQFGLYFTNDGMEPRGTRPIMNDPDALLFLVPGTNYGWPDFSTDLRPVNEPGGYFQPDEAKVIGSGYRDVDIIINREASGLKVPAAETLLEGTFPSQSGAGGLAFVTESSPLSAEFAGNAIVALSGDQSPFGTGGLKLIGPVGYKVMRVDVDRKQVHEFIRNTQNIPASRIKDSKPEELERPIDVKLGPAGALYVLDLGRMILKHGKPVVEKGSGQILILKVAPKPLGTTSQPAK